MLTNSNRINYIRYLHWTNNKINMKASELRIGNYVNNGISDVQIRAKHILGIENKTYKIVKPIPINDEWLVKFGFELYLYELGGFF